MIFLVLIGLALVAAICYIYSFQGFTFFCAFMEWKIPGIDTEMAGVPVTIGTLIHMDWSAWWAENGMLGLVLYIICAGLGLLLFGGVTFASFYIPFKAFNTAIPEKYQDSKVAKLFARLMALFSFPIMWYVGLHHGDTVIEVFVGSVTVVIALLVTLYGSIAVLGLVLAPMAGIASLGAAVAGGAKEGSKSDIRKLPVIVYDESHTQWKRRGIYGDHAEYYNENGGTMVIYHAEISGSSANTDAGTLHWY